MINELRIGRLRKMKTEKEKRERGRKKEERKEVRKEEEKKEGREREKVTYSKMSSKKSKNRERTSRQSCPTFCKTLDCSPPGSSVHGILQARILEWVAIPFSKGSSRPRN